MEKLYKKGFVLGRFQMLHNGHVHMIKEALKLCNQLYICIGSANESRTAKNPFDYNERHNMIYQVFKREVNSERIIIIPIYDIKVGDNTIWGKYVLDEICKYNSFKPDLYITGCEKERASWFTSEIAPDMDELRLNRKAIDVSASQCREYLKNGDIEPWKNVVPKQLHKNFSEYKKTIDSIEEEPKKALIVVDMQNDFIDGTLANPTAQKIIPEMAEFIKGFSNVIFTRDTHSENYLETEEGKSLPIKHCIEGTNGWNVRKELVDAANGREKYINKSTFGYLKWDLEDVDEIVIVGTCTDICVISNALILKAKYPDKKISVIEHLCAGSTEEKHKEAIDAMRSCQINIE